MYKPNPDERKLYTPMFALKDRNLEKRAKLRELLLDTDAQKLVDSVVGTSATLDRRVRWKKRLAKMHGSCCKGPA